MLLVLSDSNTNKPKEKGVISIARPQQNDIVKYLITRLIAPSTKKHFHRK